MNLRSTNSTTKGRLSAREKAIRKRLRDDFPHYARKCLRIRAKAEGETDGEGALIALEFNRAQRYLDAQAEEMAAEVGMVRIIGVKGRQQGFSTYVEARAFHKTTHRRGYRTFIQTHDNDATTNLFGMAKRFHEHCPAIVRPQLGYSNANTLSFSALDSD